MGGKSRVAVGCRERKRASEPVSDTSNIRIVFALHLVWRWREIRFRLGVRVVIAKADLAEAMNGMMLVEPVAGLQPSLQSTEAVRAKRSVQKPVRSGEKA